ERQKDRGRSSGQKTPFQELPSGMREDQPRERTMEQAEERQLVESPFTRSPQRTEVHETAERPDCNGRSPASLGVGVSDHTNRCRPHCSPDIRGGNSRQGAAPGTGQAHSAGVIPASGDNDKRELLFGETSNHGGVASGSTGRVERGRRWMGAGKKEARPLKSPPPSASTPVASNSPSPSRSPITTPPSPTVSAAIGLGLKARQKTNSPAAVAAPAAAAAKVAAATVGGGEGGRAVNRVGRGGMLRVKVRVRSSVYLVMVGLAEGAQGLMKEVVRAEQLRHGERAATITSLVNESTGATIHMDKPLERYDHQSPHSHTAILSSRTTCLPTAPKPSERRVLSPGVGIMALVEGGETSVIGEGQVSGACSMASSNSRRDRGMVSRQALGQGRTRSDSFSIDRLRGEVAKRLAIERGGLGVGCGPGASPAALRDTSPQSVSPRVSPAAGVDEARKGGVAGGAGAGARGKGGRAVSPARSTQSVMSGYSHRSSFSLRSSHGGGSEAVFLAQSTLTPEEMDEILKVQPRQKIA
ncbi:unnamed protein product, partial [Discosporangium mesarthrocarpum]